MDIFNKILHFIKKVFDRNRHNRYNNDILNKSIRVIKKSQGKQEGLGA